MHSPFERQNADQMRQDRRQDWLATWEPYAVIIAATLIALFAADTWLAWMLAP